MNEFLPYDPGMLPTRAPPSAGDHLHLRLDGLPPTKSQRQSLRNRNHPRYSSFVALRGAATAAMAGRAWSFGAIELNLVIRSPDNLITYTLNEYLGGVMDTLGGCSGFTFTYLPIVYEDDSQVCDSSAELRAADQASYELRIVFR